MERKVPFLIESKNGHDTEEVPESQVPEKVNEEVKNEKLVTVEKKDGSTEVVAEEKKKDEWGETFKDVKSATSTSKMKGG